MQQDFSVQHFTLLLQINRKTLHNSKQLQSLKWSVLGMLRLLEKYKINQRIEYVHLFWLYLLLTAIPEPPVIMHLESGSSFIRVTWKDTKSIRGEPVMNYLVQAIDDKNPYNVLNCSDVTNNSCTIYGLEPDTTYLVRLQATNAEGYSFSAHEKVVTKYKGKPFYCARCVPLKVNVVIMSLNDWVHDANESEFMLILYLCHRLHMSPWWIICCLMILWASSVIPFSC